MSKFKPALTKQSLIFGYNVNDFLPENHIARLIDQIVEELDTKKIEKKTSRLERAKRREFQPMTKMEKATIILGNSIRA